MIGDDIIRTLDNYAAQFPCDARHVAELRQLMGDGGDVTSRNEFRGHVTSGAVVVANTGKVLMIRHRVLNRWLFPGGHVEIGDATLRDAAIRELSEETGVSGNALQDFDGWAGDAAFYFDAHPIPANPAKNEAAHRHFGFIYLFRGTPENIALQTDEVSDWAWMDVQYLPPPLMRRFYALGIASATRRITCGGGFLP